MKKNDKKLQKAYSLFESGNYEEALNICGKILEKDYNNEDALTLESRILYYSGDLNEAKLTWKINSDYNDNIECKQYLNNVTEYNELKNLYEDALKDIEKGNVDNAILKLNKCSTSSFNKFNVKKALENCSSIKKGITPTTPLKSSYEEQKADSLIHSLVDEKITKEIRAAIQKELAKKENAKKSTDNISSDSLKESKKTSKETIKNTSIDQVSNKEEIKESKELIENIKPNVSKFNSTSNNNIKNNKAFKITTVVIVGAIVAGIAFTTIKNTNFSNKTENAESIKNNVGASTSTTHEFPTKNFESAITTKNINELYTLLTSTQKSDANGDNLKLYNKAEEIMKVDGVEKFYKDGFALFKEKKYADSIPYFEKALKFSDKNYLQPHIIYFTASANENLGNKDEAIKYYEMYINKYLKHDSEGDDPFYSPEALYKLANYYKDKDKTLSKKYASLIEADFPNSIFYNDITMKLIYN
ncbi:tetratricopeptide repeat protein [Clostridium tarantellae]|uniref:Uncharacterized protein n=1 Tax=Clostridium tarantellae TaxID=39493 RepID=A0A6I1MQA5_9CLOT|nr:tetratricopeptide repeat protein [Clostridium tarantellae]MPQ44432.1 hypothetical protein [Clostridium tarantellae]